MVLRGNVNLIQKMIFNWVISATVSKWKLVSLRPERKRHDLGSHADSEHRFPAQEAFDRFDRLFYVLGIARSVREHETVRCPIANDALRRAAWKDGNF